jgi:hypothetical protein
MKSSETVLLLPSVTATVIAGDWRDQTSFCFVSHGEAQSETFASSLQAPSPDLIDALIAFDAVEDEVDLEAARVVLADPSERPAIAWDELRKRNGL